MGNRLQTEARGMLIERPESRPVAARFAREKDGDVSRSLRAQPQQNAVALANIVEGNRHHQQIRRRLALWKGLHDDLLQYRNFGLKHIPDLSSPYTQGILISLRDRKSTRLNSSHANIS